MSNYTIVTNFVSKDALISGNPLKLIKGADFTTEFAAVQTAVNTKFDGAVQFAPDGNNTQPSFGFTNNAGVGMYNTAGVLSFATATVQRMTISAAGLVTALAGLTVSGAAFTSRGITDSATATALTLASTGAVSIAAATAAQSLSVTGAANSYAIGLISSATASQAFGLAINAGTNTTDRALHITNQAVSTTYFDVYGDGSVTIGSPTGGSQGVGSLNTTTLWVNGSPLYVGAPQNSQAVSYAPSITDQNRHIYFTVTGKTLAMPANASVAFPIGTMITVVNAAAVTTTLTVTTDTLLWSPTGNTGSRTLAPFGVATYLKITATSWILTGSGIT